MFPRADRIVPGYKKTNLFSFQVASNIEGDVSGVSPQAHGRYSVRDFSS